MTSAEQEDPSPLAILDDYDFALPESSIAQAPTAERDSARLLVLDGETGKILESGPDHRVRDLTRWLRRGDLLVMNSTRVRSARLVGRKVSGGAAEALLLGPDVASQSSHRALIQCTGRIRDGLAFHFGPNSELDATITAIHDRGEVTLRFASEVDPYAHGQPPLPPYIRRPSAQSAEDLERYQTIYAKEPGAIAAPTAGLHFTGDLLAIIRDTGTTITELTLHVVLATCAPVSCDRLDDHPMHAESGVVGS